MFMLGDPGDAMPEPIYTHRSSPGLSGVSKDAFEVAPGGRRETGTMSRKRCNAETGAKGRVDDEGADGAEGREVIGCRCGMHFVAARSLIDRGGWDRQYLQLQAPRSSDGFVSNLHSRKD